jgi:hypothetical protein
MCKVWCDISSDRKQNRGNDPLVVSGMWLEGSPIQIRSAVLKALISARLEKTFVFTHPIEVTGMFTILGE